MQSDYQNIILSNDCEVFELPIHIYDVDVTTDCWIYSRLAIIKTSPYYNEWVASHYNLYATDKFNFHFGNMNLYPPSYHDEILKRAPLRLLQLKQDNLIKLLKYYIKNGNYIVMTIKPYKNKEYYHEVVFYGFNDFKQCLLCVGLKNEKFQKILFEYKYLEETLQDIQKYFFDKIHRGLHLALNFQYPLTIMKLNDSFRPNNCAFEAFAKLKHELFGEKIDISKANSLKSYEPSTRVHKGISCLDVFEDMLKNEISGSQFDRNFRGIVSATKKLLEHRTMLLCSMKYLCDVWGSSLKEDAENNIKLYNQCKNIIEKWFFLSLKYKFTKNIELLKTILLEIPVVFDKEKQSLSLFVNNSFDLNKLNRSFL